MPRAITIKTYPEGPPYGATANTTLVAFQDGDGAWRALQGSNGVYSAMATGEPYAVAEVCADPVNHIGFVQVQYLTTADTTEVHALGCSDAGLPTVQVSLAIAGVVAGQHAVVAHGELSELVDPARPTASFAITKDEPLDLVAWIADSARQPLRIYRGDALAATADQVLTYDLSVLGAPPVDQPLTLLDTDGAENVTVDSGLRTRPTQPVVLLASSISGAAPDHYLSVPVAAGRRPDDLTHVRVFASHASAPGRTAVRQAEVFLKTPAAITQALPAPWLVDPPVLDTSPLRRATVTIPITPAALQTLEYTVSLDAVGADTDPVQLRELMLTIGAGRTAGKTSVTLTTPDLSSLPGWRSELPFPTTQSIDWRIERADRNRPFDAVADDGELILTNQVRGQLPAVTAAQP